VIDGKLMATEIRSKIADQVRQMKKCLGKVPGLAVILVGQRRDSLTYVHNKIIACEEVGMKSVVTELPTDCADDDVQNAVMRFNKDPSIHGILVQLPLPQVISGSIMFFHYMTKFHNFSLGLVFIQEKLCKGKPQSLSECVNYHINYERKVETCMVFCTETTIIEISWNLTLFLLKFSENISRYLYH
jgi:5,10-methylene-tetrahydrofolate dehydrogenase/methenyl tetrahydrofolate cyclohydrolase